MSDSAIEALAKTNFTLLDWAIVGVYLLISLAIGLMVNKYATNMTSYITAGRGLGTWLGVATMTGTELGLITVMYSAEKGYKGGFAAFHIAVIAGLVTFMVGATGFIVQPLRKLKVLTIPEYYERRYSRSVRIVGGSVLAFAGILNMGLFLQIGSKFVVGVTGLSHQGWALPAVMTTLLALVLFYTVLGGMISVVITDYIQFVLLSLGLLLATGLAIARLGWDNIFAVVEERLGEPGFNPLHEGGGFGPSYMLWMAFAGLIGCAVWPTAVARALAMESPAAVKRQYMLSSISFTIRFLVPYFWGICALVFIATQAADLQELFPVDAAQIAAQAADDTAAKEMKPLDAMPIFMGRLLPTGLIGLISAAMIAAFMSTHDSYLLCWSSVLTQDVIAPLCKGGLSTKARVLLTRVFIVAIGIFILIWGLTYKGGDDIWDYMAMTGAVYFIGAVVLLAGGLYWKRASSTGALCALLTSCLALLGLEPLRARLGLFLFGLMGESISLEEASRRLSSAYTGLAAIEFTVFVFVVVSLLFPDRPNNPESKGEAA